MPSLKGERGLLELVSRVANGRNRFIVMGDFNLSSIDWEVLRPIFHTHVLNNIFDP